jgi:hypothetical protein
VRGQSAGAAGPAAAISIGFGAVDLLIATRWRRDANVGFASVTRAIRGDPAAFAIGASGT